MLNAYLDSSALFKLYYPEAETEMVSRWVNQNNQALTFTPLHEVELNNALSLKVFRKELSKTEQNRVLKSLESDLQNGVLQRAAISWEEVFSFSTQLSHKYTPRMGCRSLDILHIALAIYSEKTHFLTFDDRQKRLAKIVGLKIINIR